MSIFQCDKCLKIFNRILHYNNHLNRKTPCKITIKKEIDLEVLEETIEETIEETVEETIEETVENIQENNLDNNINIKLDSIQSNILILNKKCKYCKKEFSRNDSLLRHLNLNSCKVKKVLDSALLKEIQTLKKKLIEQSKEINQININTNNSINSNNVTNQINIVSIGKEDMSKLTQEELLKIATSGVFYPIVAAEIIYCNERLTDYQNILISNLRSSKGHLYNIDGTWMTKNQDDIIRRVMDVDKVHVTNIIKDVKVDDEKIKNKIQFTKDELKENKSHQCDKIKDKLYSASKMIIKNKQKNNKK